MKKQRNNLITQAQIKKIWVEAKQMGLTEEYIYEMIGKLGKTSMKAMTKEEAKTLIDVLLEVKNGNKEESNMATDAQIYKIYEYSDELKWNEKSLMKFISKYAHIDHINWLDKKAASNIIEALKNISLRQKQ